MYEQKPVMDIEVEILNGCGVSGLASKVSDLLRDNNVDVVRSENADNFNYTQTMLILRNENLEDLNYVAKSLGLNPAEDPRVIHQPDESLSVDLTLILEFNPSVEIFLIKFKKTELPSFKISLFNSKISEKIKSSNTLVKSVSFKIA